VTLLRAFTSSGDAIADKRLALAEGYLSDGDTGTAIGLARQALELVPAFAPGWFMVGEASMKAGDAASAIAAFRTVLELDPLDRQGARLRLAALGEWAVNEAMTDAYIATLFDRYAPLFESHIIGVLQYRGPEKIVAALKRAAAAEARSMHFGRAIDLGCGTGLMGEEIVAHVGWLAGCDLSPEMVARAEGVGNYGHLAVSECTDFLRSQGGASADLLLAADVLVYIADLAPLLAECARVLAPGGLIAFSTQTHPGKGVIVGADLRFQHAPAHVTALAGAAGLRVVLAEEATTRRDAGKPVPSMIHVLAHGG
jgi:predicted TPR repeat methyltransferase